MTISKPKRRKRAPNPLKMDPTRTATLRRSFAASLKKRFARLRFELRKLLIDEDAFGLVEKKRFVVGNVVTVNDRWRFHPNPEKIKAFQAWLRQQLQSTMIGRTDEELWQAYTEAGFRKGMARSFDDTKRTEKALAAGKEKLDFYQGNKDQFLRSSFNQPVAVEKVKLLAGRSFDDLEGVTADMSVRMSRTLTDGLVQGKGPREIARDLNRETDIGQTRALTIARTELIRAHASGQLHALGELGVEEVGVAVEWTTSGLGTTALGNPSPCEICDEMQGVVLKLAEAEGMIPLHPNCVCSWIPSGVGESTEDQKNTKASITDAIKEAHRLGGDDDDEGGAWGPGQPIAKDRPESILNRELLEFSRYIHNVYCATGEGGGVDPSCSVGGGVSDDKAKFVGAKVGAAVHAHAESVKNYVAKAVGGIPEELTSDAGQKDKKPYDVKLPSKGKDHDIEVKSMTVGGKTSISVHEDALLRKVEHVQRTGNEFHTVVVDEREKYDGGVNKENYSGHRLYYKRGSGRYSLKQMHQVKDEAELKRLILTPADKLPEAARGSLPPPPPIDHLREVAARATESRKARDSARKERNKDLLREQARARAAKKRELV